jgi:hypothetical protein
MRQHQIDLLPDSMRAQTQARATASRNLGVIAGAVAVVIAVITHSKMEVDSATERLETMSAQAAVLEQHEARAAELQKEIQRCDWFIGRYDAVALPIEMSSIVATIANELPPSVTLERLDLDAGERQAKRTARNAAPLPKDERPPRILIGELAGFALSDQDIADLVSRLDRREPFQAVSLDFSKQRVVRGVSARDFRLSFIIDLERDYVVLQPEAQRGRGIANVE